MNPQKVDALLQVFRKGALRVWCREELPPDRLLPLLAQAGELLKSSRKSTVRRVGRYVIKESRGPWLVSLLRHTFTRARYQRAWFASHRLESHGVGTPQPLAFVEHGFLGLVWRRGMVSEYLDGYRNVEQFLAAIIQQGAGQDAIGLFLEGLADAVNALTAAGAYHADLSGKNIYTRDGQHFRFIDLDAVELDVEYGEDKRLRNHIQLYDSFCDQVNDVVLVPFITRMLTPAQDPRVWMPSVRKGQHTRRSLIEKKWAKQGKAAKASDN